MKAAFRVLFLVENVPYRLDTRVRRQAHVVLSLGGEATVICPSDGTGWRRNEEGVRIYQYPKPSLGGGVVAHLAEYSASLFFHLVMTAWIYLRHGFDIIHTANPPDILWVVAAPYKLLGKKYVFDHHDLVPELFQVRFGHRFPSLQKVMLWLERRGLQAADHVISTNKSFRNVALTRGGKRSDQVTIVRNGPWLSQDFKNVVPRNSVRQLGSCVVGYLGIMNAQDHLDNLLRAASIVRHDLARAEIGFVLVGSGDAYADLVRLRDRLGLRDAVSMPGTLPWEDVLAVLAATDICVQPDPPTAFNVHLTMNKLMEYMALGKATVAYDMIETRASGEDAIYYVRGTDSRALADAIVALADDAGLRRQLATKAMARVSDSLCWERQIESLANVYRSVLGVDSCLNENDQRLVE